MLSVREILNNLKKALEVKYDKEIIEFLEVNTSTYSSWKQRNSLDYELIISKCKHINLNWLFTGNGPIFLSQDPEPEFNHIAEPAALYGELDNQTRENINAIIRDEQITPGELLDAIIQIRRVRRKQEPVQQLPAQSHPPVTELKKE